jgi:hypothetical protein
VCLLLQIIHINLTSESPQPLTSGAGLTFTYQVQWKASSIPFVRRFERYLDFNFFEHQASRTMDRTGRPLGGDLARYQQQLHVRMAA